MAFKRHNLEGARRLRAHRRDALLAPAQGRHVAGRQGSREGVGALAEPDALADAHARANAARVADCFNVEAREAAHRRVDAKARRLHEAHGVRHAQPLPRLEQQPHNRQPNPRECCRLHVLKDLVQREKRDTHHEEMPRERVRARVPVGCVLAALLLVVALRDELGGAQLVDRAGRRAELDGRKAHVTRRTLRAARGEVEVERHAHAREHVLRHEHEKRRAPEPVHWEVEQQRERDHVEEDDDDGGDDGDGRPGNGLQEELDAQPAALALALARGRRVLWRGPPKEERARVAEE
mmetsp:Transcript_27955/g.61246  ORF Transcript_27955/g.61246 Transcript_27955/m.61246 type:complete len:294 (+) Transcript_27955:945-1826(+)